MEAVDAQERTLACGGSGAWRSDGENREGAHERDGGPTPSPTYQLSHVATVPRAGAGLKSTLRRSSAAAVAPLSDAAPPPAIRPSNTIEIRRNVGRLRAPSGTTVGGVNLEGSGHYNPSRAEAAYVVAPLWRRTLAYFLDALVATGFGRRRGGLLQDVLQFLALPACDA